MGVCRVCGLPVVAQIRMGTGLCGSRCAKADRQDKARIQSVPQQELQAEIEEELQPLRWTDEGAGR